MNEQPLRAYFVGAVRDVRGTEARPGVVLTQGGRILSAGSPDDVPARDLQKATRIERPGHLLLPSLVNAHTHLDLTDLGPRAYDGDFSAWLRGVTDDRPMESERLRAAVRQGVRLCREAGVEFVGDVAYSPDAVQARQEAALPGVSYLEAFGLGVRQREQIERLRERLEALEFETPVAGHARGVVLGISPHAPYTAGLEMYRAASRLSERGAYRLCSHVAEMPAEIAFLRDGTGPVVSHLRHFGVSDEDIRAAAAGLHPIDHLKLQLRRARWLLVHCNYVEDAHLKLLRKTGTSVVYCPIASAYFGHPASRSGGGHRYRDMLEAGVNVCLGTDSIVCQPREEAQPMSILAQMRYLYRRDGTDPQTLLEMATVNGMHALEFRSHDATLEEGAPATFATVRMDPNDGRDPLVQALTNDEPVEPLRDVDFGRDPA